MKPGHYMQESVRVVDTCAAVYSQDLFAKSVNILHLCATQRPQNDVSAARLCSFQNVFCARHARVNVFRLVSSCCLPGGGSTQERFCKKNVKQQHCLCYD